MKNVNREIIYQGAIILMIIGYIVFFIKSHNNYMDLLIVNDELTALQRTQKINSETKIEILETKFSRLQSDYAQLLVENDELKSKLEEVELPVYSFTEEEIQLLARCVEAEAGDYDNHKVSQQYVAQVILNRLHSGKFPNSIKEVIYQKNGNIPQFSVAYNGMIDREVDQETLANVYEVIVHGTDLPKYVHYFYSDYVTENWVNTLPIHDVVEGTVFAYKNKEE